ncbi:MAG: Hpt domain-containing protein [Synechococcales bacterium]|nr:Hpt domain-containing protein [Synechococcales bacterium]
MTKQQQILGYFIEEAKEHLDTIEKGLLNLQATMADPEEMNCLFRAAHSIKGGAAMLGFDSIQKTGHHLEDYFKLLKENPVKVDAKLEDLFLKGFDSLKALIEVLQSPFGLRPEDGEQALKESEPIFANLGNHLNALIQGGATPPVAAKTAIPTNASAQVNNILKLMLQLFKQGDSPKARQQLVGLCARLAQLDKTSQPWVTLLQVIQRAIANPKTAFSTLAPLVIKELKQASNLLLTGQASEILPSQALQKLSGQPIAQLAKLTPQSPPSKPLTVPEPETSAAAAVVVPPGSSRARQIAIPADPRGAARALLEQFNKAELIQIAEFLMKAIQ